MKKISEKTLWLLSVVILLVLFSLYLLYQENKSENIEINYNNQNKPYIVKDYNNFYTVDSCVYRYLTYLQAKDTEALLKVLDVDYVKKNNIDSNNIFNYLSVYDSNVTFKSLKMFEEKLSNNVYKFYVYGYVEKDIMDSLPEQIDTYFIVILDKNEDIFSIQPYSGELFK